MTLLACSSNPKTEDTDATRLYQTGLDYLDSGYTARAVETFNQLQTLHPSGEYTENAWLQKSYANLLDDQPTLAQIEVREFIRNYPNHQNIDYALFLQGFSEHAKVKNFVNLNFNGLYETDTQSLILTKRYYQDLVNRFPSSPYTIHARGFIQSIDEDLARHEIKVAQHYADNQRWVASILRAQHAIKNYPKTSQLDKAWSIIVESYRALGLEAIAVAVSNTIKHTNKAKL